MNQNTESGGEVPYLRNYYKALYNETRAELDKAKGELATVRTRLREVEKSHGELVEALEAARYLINESQVASYAGAVKCKSISSKITNALVTAAALRKEL